MVKKWTENGSKMDGKWQKNGGTVTIFNIRAVLLVRRNRML